MIFATTEFDGSVLIVLIITSCLSFGNSSFAGLLIFRVLRYTETLGVWKAMHKMLQAIFSSFRDLGHFSLVYVACMHSVEFRDLTCFVRVCVLLIAQCYLCTFMPFWHVTCSAVEWCSMASACAITSIRLDTPSSLCFRSVGAAVTLSEE